MGRYDKIRVFNGSSWVQPSRMYVWNGSSWVDYGTNDSDNTRSLYTYNGSSWTRKTLNKVVRQTGTNYTFDTWVSFWPNGNGTFGGRSNATYFSGGGFNCTIPAGYASWDTLSWDLLDHNNTNAYGYATSNLNYPNVWRDFYFRWPGQNKWIHNIVWRAVTSSVWQGCPSQTEFWAGDRGSFIGYYTFTNPGGADNIFYNNGIDYKPNGGVQSITLAIYDGEGWKRGNYSLRMRATMIEGGNANTVPVYTTYWE